MMRILGERVLVALPAKETTQDPATGYTYQEKTTASGLILATPADAYDVEIATRGIVMALGEKRGQVDLEDVRAALYELSAPLGAVVDENWETIDEVLHRLGPAPFDVEVGDCVIFPASAGEQFVKDGVTYAILRESDIAGVLTPAKEQAA